MQYKQIEGLFPHANGKQTKMHLANGRIGMKRKARFAAAHCIHEID